MSNLNYVPSWLDSAMTLLEKLNKCIEKIETIVNTVVSVTKTADDALNLAKANQVSIGLNETEIRALQTKTATLETNVTNAANKADNALTEATLANTTANNAEVAANEATAKANTNATNITALQNEKSGKLYLHEIFLKTGSYEFKFFSITEESKKYSDKIKNGEAFFTTLKPFNCVLSKAGSVMISKSLTLQLTDITLNDKQNCNGSITFAAYLDDNNQIVTITDYPEWYSATIENEIVTEL